MTYSTVVHPVTDISAQGCFKDQSVHPNLNEKLGPSTTSVERVLNTQALGRSSIPIAAMF